MLLLLALLIFTLNTETTLNMDCNLDRVEYYKDGDFLFGAILELIDKFDPSTLKIISVQERLEHTINQLKLPFYCHFLAFIYAIEEINANLNLLPNVTLGYHVFDSRGNESLVQEGTLRILTGREELIPNYRCSSRGVLAGFIGDRLSTTTLSMARLTDLFGYSQISYGAMDLSISDRLQFPYLFKTVPDERAQHVAIIRIIQHFGWTWVGILASDDENSQRGSQELKEQIINSVGCLAYLQILPKYTPTVLSDIYAFTKLMEASAANVVILYTSSKFSEIFQYLWYFEAKSFIWVMASTWTFIHDISDLLYINGSLVLSPRKGNIPGFKDFLNSVSPPKYPNDCIFHITWCNLFQCSYPICSKVMDPVLLELGLKLYRPCTGNETVQTLPDYYYDVNNFKTTYSIYIAVYALAHALHAMLISQSFGFLKNKTSVKMEYNQWQLVHYLKKINFFASSDEIYFEKSGNLPGSFDIENLIVYKNLSFTKEIIGHFHATALENETFFINGSAINWHSDFMQMPRSTCSDTCETGYRKSPQETDDNCCYECVQCQEGEITNMSDMANCFPCPEDQWSNEGRDKCIPRTIEFLSTEDPLGASLVSVAVVLSIITVGVLGLFVAYRDTPVVRANNRDLSYILLISLMLSFLFTLLFIGHPVKVTCYFRQVGFGIIFAVAVSSVLAKTITVVIAFKATKPGSKLSHWIGRKVSICLVLVCSIGQVIICTVWLISSPPFPDYDTHSIPGVMILQCNEGSAIAFYTVIGYMGFLAVLSFLVAFLVRKVPDSYNEAQLITFSMLLFCCVWITFIPVYISTKGKYTVAVEVFAIISSSAGLLSCIFFHKCYIILLKPELNTKVCLMGKHSKT